MKRVAIVGAGQIGETISQLLMASGSYRPVVIDRSEARLAACTAAERIHADAADVATLRDAVDGAYAVLSASPFHLTANIASAAVDAGAHYLDLTEDVASTRFTKALARSAATVVMPQCGLAPGFITVVAADLARRFDELHDVKMRVGALPLYPSNGLNYNLTWSTDGVINEYCQPCEAIVDGELRETQPLEECESFSLDGVTYEAFNTSGGLGTLCETLQGRVRNLNYRTIRYLGHAAIMKTLLHDLGLKNRREVLKDILEHAVPTTLQDVVIVFVTVTGLRDGRLVQDTYAHKIYAQTVGAHLRRAIQITTAAGICAALDLISSGALPQSGFVRQEDIALSAFLANRFGRVYAEAPAADDAVWGAGAFRGAIGAAEAA